MALLPTATAEGGGGEEGEEEEEKGGSTKTLDIAWVSPPSSLHC